MPNQTINFPDLSSLDQAILSGKNLRWVVSEALARATPPVTHTGIMVDQTTIAQITVRDPSRDISSIVTIANLNAVKATIDAESAAADAERKAEFDAAQTDMNRLFVNAQGVPRKRAAIVQQVNDAFSDVNQQRIILAIIQGLRIR